MMVFFIIEFRFSHDTDNDGMADLVKVLVQLPRSAIENHI